MFDSIDTTKYVEESVFLKIIDMIAFSDDFIHQLESYGWQQGWLRVSSDNGIKYPIGSRWEHKGTGHKCTRMDINEFMSKFWKAIQAETIYDHMPNTTMNLISTVYGWDDDTFAYMQSVCNSPDKFDQLIATSNKKLTEILRSEYSFRLIKKSYAAAIHNNNTVNYKYLCFDTDAESERFAECLRNHITCRWWKYGNRHLHISEPDQAVLLQLEFAG